MTNGPISKMLNGERRAVSAVLATLGVLLQENPVVLSLVWPSTGETCKIDLLDDERHACLVVSTIASQCLQDLTEAFLCSNDNKFFFKRMFGSFTCFLFIKIK